MNDVAPSTTYADVPAAHQRRNLDIATIAAVVSPKTMIWRLCKLIMEMLDDGESMEIIQYTVSQ